MLITGAGKRMVCCGTRFNSSPDSIFKDTLGATCGVTSPALAAGEEVEGEKTESCVGTRAAWTGTAITTAFTAGAAGAAATVAAAEEEEEEEERESLPGTERRDWLVEGVRPESDENDLRFGLGETGGGTFFARCWFLGKKQLRHLSGRKRCA